VRRILEAVVGTIGLAAVAFAVSLVTVPGEVETVVPIRALAESTPISEWGTRTVVFGIAGGVCTVWIAWTAGSDRAEELPADSFSATEAGFGALRAEPPEHAIETAVAGEGFDDAIEGVIATAADGDDADRVRPEIRSLAVAAVADARGCSASDARAVVDDGGWTDDPVAAAYVADEEASLPFSRRALAWLRPSRTKRNRVERSIRAVDRIERRSG
jgi:hypothetical protein